MAAAEGKAKYVLLDGDNGSYETFESQEELEKYLEEEEVLVADAQVFLVDTEYRVKKSYELEEV